MSNFDKEYRPGSSFDKDYHKPATDHKSMWEDVDKHIARNRIHKAVDVDEYIASADERIEAVRGRAELPEVDAKMQTWALKKDWPRPWSGNDYMEAPEMYCQAVKRRLEVEVGQFFENYPDGVPEKPWFTVFPPPEVIPLHDAVFVEGEPVPLADPLPPPPKAKNWWDHWSLVKEKGESGCSAAQRAERYLQEAQDKLQSGHENTHTRQQKCDLVQPQE